MAKLTFLKLLRTGSMSVVEDVVEADSFPLTLPWLSVVGEVVGAPREPVDVRIDWFMEGDSPLSFNLKGTLPDSGRKDFAITSDKFIFQKPGLYWFAAFVNGIEGPKLSINIKSRSSRPATH